MNSESILSSFFNKNENQNYIGTIPDVKYYGVNTMEKMHGKSF